MQISWFERSVRLGARLLYGSFTLGSAVAIISERDTIVMVRKKHDRWALPGGFRDRDELPSEAAMREAFEETGLSLHVQAADAMALLDFQYPHMHFLFSATVLEQPLSPPRPTSWWGRRLQQLDSSNPTWVPISELGSLRLTPGTAEQLAVLGLLTSTRTLYRGQLVHMQPDHHPGPRRGASAA